jgi:hypothetical protein
MSGKTNKWGPALTDGQQAAARPTDIAATIAADLSNKLRSQLNPVCVALPQQSTFSAEFEINDSPVSNLTLCDNTDMDCLHSMHSQLSEI